jgi:hypothetical protein
MLKSTVQNVPLSVPCFSLELGCAAQFRFSSKRGKRERKPFCLEPKKLSNEMGAT